jgi:competence protein ComEC
VSRRPIVWFAAYWIAGNAVWPLLEGPGPWLALAGAVLTAAGFALAGRLSGRQFGLCLLALALSAGERIWADASNRSALAGLLAPPDGQSAVLTGRIASPVERDGDMAAFELDADTVLLEGPGTSAGGDGPDGSPAKAREKIEVRLRLTSPSQIGTVEAWARGDRLRIRGTLALPDEAGNFGAFDYRAYLKRQRIHLQLAAKGAESAQPLPGPVPWRVWPLRATDAVRQRIGALMDRLYPEQEAGYMKGLVAGIQNDVDPAQYDDFSRLGLTHVMAISGLHVGVVVLLILRIGAWMRLARERCLDLAIASMPVYMLLTGASPSAVRACVMGMIALFLTRTGRLKNGLHLLAAAAVLMTAWNPLVVEDVGFQLSFAVTAGLLLFVPIASDWLPIRPAWARSAIAVALTAQIVSFPLTVYYFHQFHLLSLAANVLLVPFISFIVLPLGMASMALGGIWLPLGAYPAELASVCNRMTFWIVHWPERFPSLRTIWPQPEPVWVVAAYGLIGLTAWLLRKAADRRREAEWMERTRREQRRRFERKPGRAATGPEPETRPLHPEPAAAAGVLPPERRTRRMRAFAAASVAALWLLWLVWGWQPAFLDRTAKVMFLDVGQGDSILIRSGGGRFMLIDAGGTVTFHKPGDEWRQRRDPFEVGRKVLVPLLRQRGVRRLDALLLTHLDADHIGGAEAVIREVPVRRILFNGTLKSAAGVEKLFRLALARGIPIYAVHAGMRWRLDGSAELKFLGPVADAAADGLPFVDEQNTRSVVTRLSVYGRAFLLPGDLDQPGETQVLRETAPPSPDAAPVDVLKAGHHGSRTSTGSAWLARWRPAETVISVGRNNLYGHPAAETLERLSDAGSAVWRTDRNGEVQYRIRRDGSMERRIKQE